jgi:hypothetical protein
MSDLYNQTKKELGALRKQGDSIKRTYDRETQEIASGNIPNQQTQQSSQPSQGTSTKRKIPCNYCKGQVLATQNGRATSSQTLFPRLQNFIVSISDLMSALTGGVKTISRLEAIGGECKTCGGSGEIEDVTDTSEQDQAAAQYLQGKAEKILELERKLGNSPGGSMLERIAGAKVTIVGRTLNNAPSVTVHEGKATHPTAQVVAKGTPTTIGPEKDKGTNVVTGNNVPANTGGGFYYIQCGNKFKLTTGAQGIEMSSHGPISIDGTQIRLTGAEVTLGGKSGPTIIEGDHLQLNGQSIAITPSGEAGEVVIQGSASCSGNFRAGGAYIENLYAASLTLPSAQTSAKVNTGNTDLIGGPAAWTAASPAFLKLAAQNLVKWALDSTTDINLAGAMLPINPRSILKLNDNMINLIYGALPIELKPTGIAFIPPLVGPIFNFPHSHALPDSPHSHEVTVPAISHDGNSTADVVRQKFVAAGGNKRIPAPQSQNGNPLEKIVGGVLAVGKAGAALVGASSAPYPEAIT